MATTTTITEQLRYAKPVQLQALTGISAKKFSEWTNSSRTMPLEVAEVIAQKQGIPAQELLVAWSERREDAELKKAAIKELEQTLERRRIFNNHRYHQLSLKLELRF